MVATLAVATLAGVTLAVVSKTFSNEEGIIECRRWIFILVTVGVSRVSIIF